MNNLMQDIAKRQAIGHVFSEIPDVCWAQLYSDIRESEEAYQDNNMVVWQPYENLEYEGLMSQLESQYDDALSMLYYYETKRPLDV